MIVSITASASALSRSSLGSGMVMENVLPPAVVNVDLLLPTEEIFD